MSGKRQSSGGRGPGGRGPGGHGPGGRGPGGRGPGGRGPGGRGPGGRGRGCGRGHGGCQGTGGRREANGVPTFTQNPSNDISTQDKTPARHQSAAAPSPPTPSSAMIQDSMYSRGSPGGTATTATTWKKFPRIEEFLGSSLDSFPYNLQEILRLEHSNFSEVFNEQVQTYETIKNGLDLIRQHVKQFVHSFEMDTTSRIVIGELKGNTELSCSTFKDSTKGIIKVFFIKMLEGPTQRIHEIPKEYMEDSFDNQFNLYDVCLAEDSTSNELPLVLQRAASKLLTRLKVLKPKFCSKNSVPCVLAPLEESVKAAKEALATYKRAPLAARNIPDLGKTATDGLRWKYLEYLEKIFQHCRSTLDELERETEFICKQAERIQRDKADREVINFFREESAIAYEGRLFPPQPHTKQTPHKKRKLNNDYLGFLKRIKHDGNSPDGPHKSYASLENKHLNMLAGPKNVRMHYAIESAVPASVRINLAKLKAMCIKRIDSAPTQWKRQRKTKAELEKFRDALVEHETRILKTVEEQALQQAKESLISQKRLENARRGRRNTASYSGATIGELTPGRSTRSPSTAPLQRENQFGTPTLPPPGQHGYQNRQCPNGYTTSGSEAESISYQQQDHSRYHDSPGTISIASPYLGPNYQIQQQEYIANAFDFGSPAAVSTIITTAGTSTANHYSSCLSPFAPAFNPNLSFGS